MQPLASQIRILTWYSWLLAALAWLATYTENNLLSLGITLLFTCGAIFLMRKAEHAFLKVTLTFLGACIILLIVFILMKVLGAVLPNGLFSYGVWMFLWSAVTGFLTAGLAGGPMRAAAKAAEKRVEAAHPAVDTAAETPAVAAQPVVRSLEDPPAKEWVDWVRAHAPNPLSRRYATIAGAIRALEMGKDHAAIEHATVATAAAWAAPPNVTLRQVSDDVLSATDEPWAPPSATALSQALATRAAYLRALELGKDQAAAVQAARKTLQQWIPRQQAPPAEGARNGGELRGLVYGYMRRTETVQLGAHPLLRGRAVSMNKTVWTFALKREGKGENGRPLSPIQIRMEGSSVSGALEDGDLVELPHVPVAAEVNPYQRLRNLSKSLDIVAQPITKATEYKSYQWQRILVPVIGFLIFGIIAYAMISDFNKKSAPIRQMFPH